MVTATSLNSKVTTFPLRIIFDVPAPSVSIKLDFNILFPTSDHSVKSDVGSSSFEYGIPYISDTFISPVAIIIQRDRSNPSAVIRPFSYLRILHTSCSISKVNGGGVSSSISTREISLTFFVIWKANSHVDSWGREYPDVTNIFRIIA